MQEVGRKQSPPLTVRDQHGSISAERKERGWTLERARSKLNSERKADADHKSPDNSGTSMHELAAELLAALHRCDELGTLWLKRESGAHCAAEALRHACLKGLRQEEERAPLSADDQHGRTVLPALLDGADLLEGHRHDVLSPFPAQQPQVGCVDGDRDRGARTAEPASGPDAEEKAQHRADGSARQTITDRSSYEKADR